MQPLLLCSCSVTALLALATKAPFCPSTRQIEEGHVRLASQSSSSSRGHSPTNKHIRTILDHASQIRTVHMLDQPHVFFCILTGPLIKAKVASLEDNCLDEMNIFVTLITVQSAEKSKGSSELCWNLKVCCGSINVHSHRCLKASQLLLVSENEIGGRGNDNYQKSPSKEHSVSTSVCSLDSLQNHITKI